MELAKAPSLMVDALRLLAQACAGSLLSSFEGLAAPTTHPGGQKDRPVSVSENRAIELGQFLIPNRRSRLSIRPSGGGDGTWAC